jgi:hypothetical protein
MADALIKYKGELRVGEWPADDDGPSDAQFFDPPWYTHLTTDWVFTEEKYGAELSGNQGTIATGVRGNLYFSKPPTFEWRTKSSEVVLIAPSFATIPSDYSVERALDEGYHSPDPQRFCCEVLTLQVGFRNLPNGSTDWSVGLGPASVNTKGELSLSVTLPPGVQVGAGGIPLTNPTWQAPARKQPHYILGLGFAANGSMLAYGGKFEHFDKTAKWGPNIEGDYFMRRSVMTVVAFSNLGPKAIKNEDQLRTGTAPNHKGSSSCTEFFKVPAQGGEKEGSTPKEGKAVDKPKEGKTEEKK